eukprot:scaffold3120_cov219-Skeletonema_marinoi.AAC.3
MPKELNLSAYDFRNRHPSSSNDSTDDDDDDDGDDHDESLRQSCGTACTMGNDTVMTGDHVEAILRMQSKTERKMRLLQQQQVGRGVNSLPNDHPEDDDDESSSDSEGVVPKVCRRSVSRSNSVASTELIGIVQEVIGGNHNGDAESGDGAFTPLQSNSSSNNNHHQAYGTAMGGSEAHHPISNLLRVRQVSSNNGGGATNTHMTNLNSSDDNLNNGSSDDNKSSSNGSNVYHLQDNASALSSLASIATGGSTRSIVENKSFISAVFNYGKLGTKEEEEEGKDDGGDDKNEVEDEEERLVKSYSHHLLQKQQTKEVKEGDDEFENDEESQQQEQYPTVHHRLIHHNIRSSFTSLVGQLKDRVAEKNPSSSKKESPPPVSYSDHQEQHDEEGGQEEEEEQHCDLRPSNENDGPTSSSSSTTKRRPPRRPIHRRTTIESDSMWNRRISNESESMWTMLSSSFTRRASNGSDSTMGTANTYTVATFGAADKDKPQKHHQTLSNHDDDEEEESDHYGEGREPYDDSDIRSVKSADGSWIGMGNLGNIIGSNIVSGGSSDNGGRIRKRGGGDGKGDYHHGDGSGMFGSGGGSSKRRFNPFARHASMTPFIGEDGGDYFYDGSGSKSYLYRPGITTLRRCGAIFILLAITVLSSVLIGIYIPPSVGEGHNIETMKILGDGEEELFKIAESINQRCEASKLHSAKGRRQCERLCKNHLCCFDTIGDGYSCRGDESKNCGVYSGCEVLIDSFEELEPSGEDKDQVQKGEELDDVVALDGGFGGDEDDGFYTDDFLMYYDDEEKGDGDTFGSNAIFFNPGGQSTATQAQASSIGSLAVDNFCTKSMVKTVDGRKHCETLCKDHHCCFDPVPRNSCRKDPDKMCPSYASCEVLTLDIGTDILDANNDGTTTHHEIKVGSQVIGAACAEAKINTPSGKEECEAVCASHHCCFSRTDFNCRSDPEKSCPAYAACEILNVLAAEEGKANGVVYWDDYEGGESDPYNAVAAIELSDEQKLHIKQEINNNCKVKTSPDCFHACRDWFCCFESSDEKSCRSSANNLCNLVQQCEVAAVSADILFPSEPQEEVDQEQDDVQDQPSSQQQIQPQQEDDYYQDDFLPEGGNPQAQPSPQQMQQQDLDLQQFSFRPQQQDAAQSSVQQMQEQDDDFNSQEEDFLLEEEDESQPEPSSQQEEGQSSVQQTQQQQADFRPQPAQQQQQADSRPQPPQQQQNDFQQQPAQQQQQNDFQQQDGFQPQVQQQSSQNQSNTQPMQPQQNDFQQQDEFFQPQKQNDFQPQNDFLPPMQQQQPLQQQNDQYQPNMQPPQQQQPQQQQQNGSQTQPQYMQQEDFSQQQQQQQPITPQQQNGQRLDQPAEQQQFEQPNPMEQNNYQPPVQTLPQQTQPATQQQQSNTNAAVSKPPRPPPARCIPTGDDELHTELYNDDWNDDSYDRCKRWESKYGMKITQYLDLYGVG